MSATDCIISLGVGQRFRQGIERLRAGLDANGFQGDKFLFTSYPKDCPTHQEIPYGFKPWLFRWARDGGYKRILWMDSSCVPVQPLDGIFSQIRREGHVFPYSPLRISEWCSDACLETMGLTRAKVMNLCPSMWATVLGLNMDNPTAMEFLDRWFTKSVDGVSFHGDWTNENRQVSKDPRVKGHRHDQTVATILAFQLAMPFSGAIVMHDIEDIMPLQDYEKFLRLPMYPCPILSNCNVKIGEHSSP